MSKNTLISSLLRASQAFNRLVAQAQSPKVQGQLLALTVVFYDLAVQIRTGSLRPAADALPGCIREVDEAAAAAAHALGKTDAECALAIVEGNEAVEEVRGVAQADLYGSASIANMSNWMQPRFPDLVLPERPRFPPDGPWPPFPLPRPRPWPWPWPWPPHPWALDDIDVRNEENRGRF